MSDDENSNNGAILTNNGDLSTTDSPNQAITGSDSVLLDINDTPLGTNSTLDNTHHPQHVGEDGHHHHHHQRYHHNPLRKNHSFHNHDHLHGLSGGGGEGGDSLRSSTSSHHLRKSLNRSTTSSHHIDEISVEYERIKILAAKASKYIGKALDKIDDRSKEETLDWTRANLEFCSKMCERFEREGEANFNELKSLLFETWTQQISERYSMSSPETHDIINHIKSAHQTLFNPEEEIDVNNLSHSSLLAQQPHRDPTLHHKSLQGDLFGLEQGQEKLPFLEKAKKFSKKTFTIVEVLSTYKLEYLQNDISVGLSSGTMIIPQSMAYALLAGLPPIYGLYTAFIPPLIYSLFGSSRHLAVGPLALMSIMVGASVQAFENTTLSEQIGLANLLSLLVGVNFLIMCFLQLGFLINFLSRPVLSGFTSAAAIIIILSQTNSLFGFSGGQQQFAWKYVIQIVKNLGHTQWIAVLMSVICFLLLYVFKHHIKTIPKTTIPMPAPLILVALGLLASYFLDLEGKGIAVVGTIPSGLPSASFFTNFDFNTAISLYKDSLVIPIVGLIETVSASKVAANKCRYELSMNKELFALGMANIIGCIFQSYPSAGAFGRTSLHLASGAKTQVTTIVSVVVVGVTLLFLTKVFYYLPKVVLAAIVIFAVSQLVDLEEVQKLWKINKPDMFLLLIAFWATLVLGVQVGIATAVILSLVLVIYQSSKPNTAICGRIPGTASFTDVALHPEAIVEQGVTVFRFDSPIIFVNAYYLRKQLKKIYKLEDETKNPLIKAIILDFGAVTNVDSTGIKYLKELIRELTELSIVTSFADIRPNVLEQLKVSGIYRDLGADHFFQTIYNASKNSLSLTIRPWVEESPGLKFDCFSTKAETYQELDI
ncbi:hypothetical protein DFA_09527 [Cavenderia fasciculata]|uniref:STAS domain-containing protein n=1 Tax=Cavenderia fasciculata TaxID=261658 RepID=F4Q7V8_CACFS|nr:uncharacterized protein DFA_09527 [Cavenderia fasciculata]EGG15858.1 hypothetical protein DFA_09527 [Cavenderia fasciculata]|eukprot:XP_004352183.1 hypothetical protein DFA_09527 [Cavenderia fasciculata]